jgi:hypothetical protein
MFLGYSVYLESGLFGAIIVFIISCSTLYATSLALLRASIPNHFTSLDVVYHYFGRQGARLCAIVLTLMFLGWFLWQLGFLVHFIKHYAIIRMPILDIFSTEKIGVAVGLLCCAFACTERVGLRVISIVFVPTLLLLLCFLFFFIPFDFKTPVAKLSTIDFSALSILCSSVVTLIMFSPTFFRTASSIEVVKRSIKFTYLVLLPFFYISGVIFGIYSPSHDILKLAMVPYGIGPFILILYASICVLNIGATDLLYGADIVQQITSSKSKMPVIFLLSSIGILFFGLVNSGINEDVRYIEALGSLVVGILAIVLTKIISSNYQLLQEDRGQQHENYFALITAYCVGLLVLCGVFKITGVPFFDVALAAVIVTMYNMKRPERLKFLSYIAGISTRVRHK